jgi:hypothetical protein
MASVRTPRASAQFKSPLAAVAASGAGDRRRAVSASPNVQALQLRLQTLKRALKIRNEGEGEKLERLAQKWTDVAREVAWEVWSVVKDNVQDVTKLGGGRGALQSNWGWAAERTKVEWQLQRDRAEKLKCCRKRMNLLSPRTPCQ